MADLFLRIKADYTDAEKCREELKKVEAQLKAVDQNTSPKEISRLINEHIRYSKQLEENTSRIGRFGVYMKDAFKSAWDYIRKNNSELEESSKNEKTLLGDIKARLAASESLTDAYKKQREEAKALRDHAKEEYEASLKQQKKINDFYEKKFAGDADAAANDPKAVENISKAFAVTEKWKKAYDDTTEKYEVLNSLFEKSEKTTNKIRKDYEDIANVKLDDNEMLKSLTNQADAANDEVESLKEKLKTLEKEKIDIELNIKRHDENITNIENGLDAEKELADLERIDVSGKISELNNELDSLHTHLGTLLNDYTNLQGVQTDQAAKVDELKEKVRHHGEEEYNLRQQLYSLKEGTEEYNKVQQQIDFHHREWERYTELQKEAQDELTETKNKMADIQQQLTQNRETLSAKESEKSDLLKHYDELTEKINADNSENETLKAAIDKREKDNALLEQNNQQMQETNERLGQSIDLANQLKDMVDAYGKVYEGFSKTDATNPATRVFTNESDYNRSQELHGQANMIEESLMKGNLSEADIRKKQEELESIQAELADLDEQAIKTGEALGAKLGTQAQKMTEALFEANKKVKETSSEIMETSEKIETLQKKLEKLQEGKTAEEIEKNRDEINKTQGEILALTDKIKDLREELASANAEQKDAQDAINGTKGELREAMGELVEKKGVFGDLEDAISYLPAPLQNVANGIKGVGKAMGILMKNPLMIFLGGIALALQTVWQWFQKTEEGQRAFAKISGYVGGVLSRLEDIVIAVGGTIFKFGKVAFQAFQNPQKAITDFAKLVREKIWNLVSRTGEMFGAMGTLIKDVFTGNWDNLGKDLDNVKKKVKEAFDATPVGAMVNGVSNLVDKTVDWFSETHKVASESAKIKQDEIALGDEIEKNREKTLKLQKSMAELQATMRNTNLSKAEREKAMEEYKKAVEQQAQIQRDFAEKRMSIQRRKMDISPNDTIEERRELEHLTNDVLQADLNKQRQLTSLQRIENSINKKATGKSRERLQEEYNLLLNEQAQKEAKQIRENGYIIEQARINALKDGTEKTIAQMKLDYKKELDAATEYENELVRQKIKLARDSFYKNPKNKGKTFDPTLVDVSMTTQELQVSKAKVNEAQTKYQQRMDALMKPYETTIEKREQKEKDYQQLMDFTSEQILEKSKQIEDLSKEIEKGSDEEKEYAKRQIGLLEEEIDLLEQKQRLIKSNYELDNDENKSRWNYLIKYGDAIEQEMALQEKYQAEIDKLRASGDEWGAKSKEKEMYQALSDTKLSNLIKDPEYIKAFEDLGHASSETLQRLIKKFEEAKNAAAQNLKPDQLKAYTDAIRQMQEELDKRDPFGTLVSSMKSLFGASSEVKKWEDILDMINHTKSGSVVIDGQTITKADAEKKLQEARDEESKSLTKVQKAVIACSKTLGDFSNMLTLLGSELGGQIADITNAIGGAFGTFTGIMDSVKNYDANATGLTKVMGQASMLMNVASGMISLNMQLDSLLPDQQSLYEHYAKKQREINKKQQNMLELELMQLEERLNMENWFYENSLTQLKKSAEINKKNMEIYGQIAAAPQEIYQDASSGFAKWAPAIAGAIVGAVISVVTLGTGTGAGIVIGNVVGTALTAAIGTALSTTLTTAIGAIVVAGVSSAVSNAIRAGIDSITYKEGQTAAMNNLRVQTRHKTFFRSEQTQDLQSWLKENWKEDLYDQEYAKKYGVNIVDPEVVKKVLDDGPTLVGETRETLEDLLEYSEKIHEFMDQIHEYVSDAFSPLVDNLTDALWDWLTEGKDVMDSFRDYAADTFKNIAQDALKAMMTKQIFDPFQDQLENLAVAYATGQSINGVLIDEAGYIVGVSKIAEEMQKVIETQLPVYQKTAEIMNEAMKNVGIDMTGKSSRQQQSASANSISNISYDQADSIIGILLAHTILFEQIKAILLGMDFDENGLVQQSSLSPEVNELTLLNANAELLYSLGMETKDIAADSRDILAGMAIHVEEIRDGMVDTVVPRIKNIDDNLSKVYKLVEAQ